MAILSITGTIFALIALGYASVRFGPFEPAAMRVLGGYVATLALPALIFRALTASGLGGILDAGYLAAYLAGSLATLAAGYAWSRRRFDAQASTFRAMGMACTNSGFVGYPILLMTLPDVAGRALALNMIVENLVLIPLVLVMAERARGLDAGAALARRIARRLAGNPILLALAAGLVVAGTGMPLPAFLVRAVDLLAQSSAALSLLVIGGTLVGLPRGGRLDLAPVVAGKLLLHPLLVGLALVAASRLGPGLGGELLAAGIIMAAMPAMGIYPIIAQQYGEERTAAAAMMAMTVASFFTISALLWLLGVAAG